MAILPPLPYHTRLKLSWFFWSFAARLRSAVASPAGMFVVPPSGGLCREKERRRPPEGGTTNGLAPHWRLDNKESPISSTETGLSLV